MLPFANLSGDPAQDYFADGITEDITTDLSRIRGSFVIARNTAYTFKGKPVDMKQIAAELAVRYGLEGSVQRAGSQVRVNAQLIDVETGGHLLWADRFDGDMSDLPRLQDLVTSRLANSLNVQLVDAESRRGLRERSGDSDAIDLVMRASAILHKGFSPENGKRARELFEQALSQDGQNLDAMVGLAHVDATDILFGWSDNPTGAAKRSENYVASVLAADPDYAQAYRVRAEILLGEARPGEMLLAAQRAAALDQNMPDAYHLAGIAKIYLGRSAEAFSDFDRAIALSPRDPLLGLRLHGIGFAHLFLGHYDQAIDWELRAIEANDHRWIPYASLAAAYALTGRDTEARVAVANAKRSNQYLSIRWLKSNKWSDNPTFLQQRERWYEGLRMAGLPEE